MKCSIWINGKNKIKCFTKSVKNIFFFIIEKSCLSFLKGYIFKKNKVHNFGISTVYLKQNFKKRYQNIMYRTL